jgi:hypothetical protein
MNPQTVFQIMKRNFGNTHARIVFHHGVTPANLKDNFYTDWINLNYVTALMRDVSYHYDDDDITISFINDLSGEILPMYPGLFTGAANCMVAIYRKSI